MSNEHNILTRAPQVDANAQMIKTLKLLHAADDAFNHTVLPNMLQSQYLSFFFFE